MKRTRWIFALLLAMALVASACGGDDGDTSDEGEPRDEDTEAEAETETDEPVTLRFWVFEEIAEGNFYDVLISQFEAAYPNIDIEVTSFPEENYDTKIDTAVVAGKAPDLILIFGPTYPRQGLVLPLDDMVAEKGIDLSTFSQAIVGEGGEFSCGWEGQLYCLGSYQGISALVYNKDMFDAAGIPYPAPWPPMTPAEFVDTACRLSDPANNVWGGGAADPTAFLPWAAFVSPDGRTAVGYVNGPTVVQSFDVLAQGFADGCLPSLNILDPWIQGRDFLAKGQLGMAITDYLGLDVVDAAGVNWGTTTPPTPSGYDPHIYTWSDGVAVMSSSEYPDAAKEFVAFIATEGQRIRFETTGDIPLDSKVAEEVDWAGGIPGREEGLEVASHTTAELFIPDRWNVFGPIWDAWGYIVGGEKTAQQALDDVAPAIQENLDKAWEVWEEQG
jgi:multiple sugar transport system substrate-binding protein